MKRVEPSDEAFLEKKILKATITPPDACGRIYN
jgi:hypothetical protein